MCFGNWGSSHFIHDVLIYSSINDFSFCHVDVSQLGKDVKTHISHIILRVLLRTTKASSSHKGETLVDDTCLHGMSLNSFVGKIACKGFNLL